MKQQDDKGYYSQLLIHYYLTHESEYFRCRDKQELYQQLISGEGKVFLPDLKGYTLKVEALRALGMQQFLEPEREFAEDEIDLNRLKNMASQCNQHIKRVLGINIINEVEQHSGLKILNRLLNLLRLKLKRVNKSYKIEKLLLNDGREEIFTIWHQRDKLMLENAKLNNRNLDNMNLENIENVNLDTNNSIDTCTNRYNVSTHQINLQKLPVPIQVIQTVPF